MSMEDGSVVFYGREERLRRFGVDCDDELLWKNKSWQPGGEFCKALMVKNVGKETVKIRYTPPKTSFFSMDFPEEKTLSPGMSWSVQVVFRPIKVEPYRDHIEFTMRCKKLKRTFFIPLCAQMSRVSVSVPTHEDFGFAPIKERLERKFDVINTGTDQVRFKWEVSGPFDIQPVEGVINDRRTFVASFSPVDASVFVSKALLRVQDLESGPVVFKMSGVGKYPFVSLSESRVEFEKAIPGTRVEREVVLRNQSVVPATFSIQRVESDVLPVFAVEPLNGTLAPGESKLLSVAFSARTHGQFSCDHFIISTPGGNSISFECAGTSTGPVVTSGNTAGSSLVVTSPQALSPAAGSSQASVVQFPQCPIYDGSSESLASCPTRCVFIHSHSSRPVRYQFLVEPGGDFEVLEPYGFIPAKLEKALTIRFRARQPGNFSRRVFCLLEDQMPIYFDLVGTAFDALLPDKRPQPMLYRHVQDHRRRALLRIGRETPERLLEMLSETEGNLEKKLSQVTFPEDDETPSKSGGSTLGQLEVCQQLLTEPLEGNPQAIVALSTTLIDFGAGSRFRGAAEKRVFTVTNRHRSRVTCSWTVSGGPGGAPPAFDIFPQSEDIAPGQSCEFRVVFHPHVDNMYFQGTASAHVHLKTNRSFRLVHDKAFVPPFFVSVQLFGHSFAPDAQQFLPKTNVLVHSAADSAARTDEGQQVRANNPHVLEFPVCHLGEAVYSQATVENVGDTPCKFDVSVLDPGKRFECFPRAGVIQPGGFQIFFFENKPASEGESRALARVVLNNSAENSIAFQLVSYCALPRAILVEPGQLVQEKTATPPTKDTSVVLLSSSSPLSPGGSSQPPASSRSRASWLAEAAADEESHIFLRRTCVGLSTNRSFVVKNSSRVPIDFEWHVPRRFRQVISISPACGRLRGNESASLSLGFSPTFVGCLDAVAVLVARSISGSKDSAAVESRRLLRVTGEGSDTFVSLSSQLVDMGTVLANSSSEQWLELKNNAGSEVGFALSVSSSGDAASEAYLRLSELSGAIPARSTRRVRLEFAPLRCGAYAFNIKCVCGSIQGQSDESGQVVLSCAVSGSAADPTLAVEDARSSLSSPAALWRQFDIGSLNRVLASPISAAEEAFLKSTGGSSDQGEEGQSGEDPASKLEVISFRFAPAAQGSAPQEVALQFKNQGKLPVSFRFKFPNESDIEIEPWAASGEPKEEELRQSFMLDEKIFDVTPRNGQLGPGDALVVRFTYRHASLSYDGMHDLELLLLVKNGKQMRLRLEGRTLDPWTPEPALFPSAVTNELRPTRIGLRYAPIQEVEFLNPASVPVTYQLDQASLETLAANNFGFPVLECINPTGVVAAGARHSLRLVFRPIESKSYECTLSLQLSLPLGGEDEQLALANQDDEHCANQRVQLVIHLLGQGCDSGEEVARRLARMSTPPTQQLLPQRGQMASLSTDKLDFGVVPHCAVESRIAFVRNQTAGRLVFQWSQDHPMIERGLVRVEPNAGVLEPGAFAIVKLTVCSLVESSAARDSNDGGISGCLDLVDADFRCEVYPWTSAGQIAENNVESISVGGGMSKSFRTESRASSNRSLVLEAPRTSPAKKTQTPAASYGNSEIPHARQSLFLHIIADILHDSDLAPSAMQSYFCVPPNAPAPSCAEGLLESEEKDDDEPQVADKLHQTQRAPPLAITADTLFRSSIRDASVENALREIDERAETPLFVDFLHRKSRRQGNVGVHSVMRDEAMAQDHCQRVIEQAVENTVLNIVNEAAHGEIDITSFRTLLMQKNQE